MFCFIKKHAACMVACWALASPSVAQQPAIEIEAETVLGRVVFQTAGDSRYELEAGNIIVFSWGGVEIEYYGFLIKAEELRYNKVLQQGSLEGGVLVQTKGLEFSCERIVLDGLAGELNIPGPIQGKVAAPELTFFAGQAKISFPPGSLVEDVSDLSLKLSGNVVIQTAAGLRFKSSGLVYDGATNQISSAGEITIDAQTFSLPGSGIPVRSITNLEVVGQSMVATIGQNGMLVAAEIQQLSVKSREVYLEATTASVTTRTLAGTTSWDLLIEGAPLRGGILQEHHNLSFVTSRALMTIAKYGLETLELDGGVEVGLEDSTLLADQVIITRTKEGYVLKFPGTLTATFSLGDFGGSEFGEAGAIEKWLGS